MDHDARLLKLLLFYSVFHAGLINSSSAATSRTTLHAASGQFQTPNYPNKYDSNWDMYLDISLQPFETIRLISGDDSPVFEQTHDYFKVKVEGNEVLDLGKQKTAVGQEWWKFSATKTSSSTQISLHFHSDGSVEYKGLKGTYEISCTTPSDVAGNQNTQEYLWCLNGGTCRSGKVSTQTRSISCICARGYRGERCETQYSITTVEIQIKDPAGEISTPNFPQPYEAGQAITWNIEVADHEELEFFRGTNESAQFDPSCPSCDTFGLYVDGNLTLDLQKLPAGTDGASLARIQAGAAESKSVQVKFESYGERAGKGFKIQYRISCDTGCTFSRWCLNGGTCNMATVGDTLQKVCRCTKGYTGPRCEDRVTFTAETVPLVNATGTISTPNFPSEYPPGKNVTWTLSLQAFEKVTFSLAGVTGTPDFETCCDRLELIADEEAVPVRLNEVLSQNKTDLDEPVFGPKNLSLEFVSDGGITGKGMQLTYEITCADDSQGEPPCLNGGTCTVSRTEQSVEPVKCLCPKQFYGLKCEHRRVYTTEIRDVFMPEGFVETPNFPSPYPAGKSIVWRFQLQPYEKLILNVPSIPNFEECCDSFRLLQGETVLADFGKGLFENNIVVHSSAGEDVTLQFMSDERIEGTGLRLSYSIKCDDEAHDQPCQNGASCSLNRNSTSAGPVFCSCPKNFAGPRCQDTVQQITESLELKDKSGFFQSPGYPSSYSPGRRITWHLNLQPFEVLTIEKSDPFGPDLEECCDSFKMYVNGALKYDFLQAKHYPAGAVLKTIMSEGNNIDIKIAFISDGGINGNGFRGKYTIGCIEGRDNEVENTCMNRGICSVERTPTSVQPVKCKCAKGFRGPRCKEPVQVPSELHHLEAPTGKIRTPGYPGHYENVKNVTWTWNLKQYEVLKLRKLSERASNFEDCCDHLTFVHDQGVRILNDLVKLPGTHDLASIHADEKGIQVSLTFISDGAINGAGVEIGYTIGCQVSACFDNGTCLVTRDGISGKRCTLDSVCPHPWISNANKDHCILLSGDQVDEIGHNNVCSQREAKVAEIMGLEDNQIIGMEAKSPLVWIGLSDSQSERDWRWINLGKPPLFANWGPGYPSGQGDFAVMYPNRWTLGDCQEKKRFLCETMDPYCPSEWIRPDGTKGKCYYQSKYELDFRSAASMCSVMAPGGHLAHWDGQTALAFGPEQWDCSPGEGLAHFWVGLGKCQPLAAAGPLRVPSPKSKVYKLPVVDSKETIEPFGITAIDETIDDKAGPCGFSMKLESCGFLFPNAWADFSTSNVDRKYSPTVACERETNFEYQQLEPTKENEITSTMSTSPVETTMKFVETTSKQSEDQDLSLDEESLLEVRQGAGSGSGSGLFSS